MTVETTYAATSEQHSKKEENFEFRRKEIWKKVKPPELPVIIYEGPENSGKTTIKRLVNEMLNHKSLSFERWTGTQYAHGRQCKRSVNLNELLEMDERFDSCFRTYLVFLFAESTHLKNRANNDPIMIPKYNFTLEELDSLVQFYFEWYDRTPFSKKMYFDTSRLEPTFIAEKIVEKVKEDEV